MLLIYILCFVVVVAQSCLAFSSSLFSNLARQQQQREQNQHQQQHYSIPPMRLQYTVLGTTEAANVHCETLTCGSECGKGFHNCSSAQGWKANIVRNDDGSSNTTALLYMINGVLVCERQQQQYAAAPVAETPFPWPFDYNNPLPTVFPGATNPKQLRFTGGRYVLSMIAEQDAASGFFTPVAGQQFVSPDMTVVSEWAVGVSANVSANDPRFDLPSVCFKNTAPAKRTKTLTLKEALLTHRVTATPDFLASSPPPPLPSSVDNRKYCNPVRNQMAQVCGSCWACSSASVAEIVQAKATGNLPPNSNLPINSNNGSFVSATSRWYAPQYLIDCVHDDGDEAPPPPAKCLGCQHGWAQTALSYIAKNGIPLDRDYPYQATTGTRCRSASKHLHKPISRVFALPSGNTTAIMQAVSAYGAVAAGILAPFSWTFWGGGFQHGEDEVFDVPDAECAAGEGHFVVIVGYGTTANGIDYWIVRNSFSAAYGDAGYVKMVRGSEGNCFLEQNAVAAVPY